MTREHWTQSLGIVLTLALSGGAMISISTWNLSNKIADARADAAQQISAARSEAASQIAVIVAKQAADESKLQAIEQVEKDHHLEDIAARVQTVNQLNQVIQGLADVRVDVGKITPRGK